MYLYNIRHYTMAVYNIYKIQTTDISFFYTRTSLLCADSRILRNTSTSSLCKLYTDRVVWAFRHMASYTSLIFILPFGNDSSNESMKGIYIYIYIRSILFSSLSPVLSHFFFDPLYIFFVVALFHCPPLLFVVSYFPSACKIAQPTSSLSGTDIT